VGEVAGGFLTKRIEEKIAMGKKDARIDAYIEKSAEFAKPVLLHLRKLVHAACPQVEETMKWSFPHFDYKGMLCSMASFKQHCAFGFWKERVMADPHQLFSNVAEPAMGSLGRVTKLNDLPPNKILIQYIQQAMKLNDDGVTVPKSQPTEKKKLTLPAYFKAALQKNKKARQTFEAFSPTNKREYIEWVTEAKNEETRERRLETAIEWISEGKVRNWKYIKK
jgi:uncharacterized protein YdeI (YjbR/CyaY-like superfamily)